MLHIIDTVNRAIEHLSRARAPADSEDLRQHGHMVALDAMQRYPDRACEPGYLYTVVLRQMGQYLSKNLAAVSMGAAFDRARQYQYRVPIDKLAEVLQGEAPDFVELERSERLRRWRGDVRAYLEDRVFPQLPEGAQPIVERLFGLNGHAPMRSSRVAGELGIDVRTVYRTRVRLISTLANDLEFYGLNVRYDRIWREDEG